MEFLGVGYQELILVFVLMLIFVGPERMPAVAYQIGRAVRTMQKYARAVRDEFSDEIGYIEEQYKAVKGEVEDTRSALRSQQAELEAGLRDVTPAALPPLLPPLETTSSGTPEAPPSGDTATPGAAPAEPIPEERTSTPPLVF